MSHFRTIELSDPAIAADGLRFVTVKSPALGRRADLCLWTPEDVAQGPLPLVVLLHGVYGSHWAWALKGGAHRMAARLVAEGALPPVVLAMPSDGLWGDGSGYLRHGGGDFERWVMEDVPHAAAEATGLCDPRAPFLLAGLSMGGFAALRLAGRHPGRIAAAAGHSSATDAAGLAPLIEEDIAGWGSGLSVLAALEGALQPLPPLYFDCGLDDPYLAGNRALSAALEARGIPHLYREAAGGHGWDYWQREIENSLRFFGSSLAARQEKKGG